MTHLVDTSVWHAYGRNPLVQEAVDDLAEAGALFTTCPAVVAEYCYSAQTSQQMKVLQADMGLLYLLESESLMPRVLSIQESLWSAGRIRAVGASDTVIAAYSAATSQTLVTCDRDFLHIASATNTQPEGSKLRVLHISPQGALTSIP